MAGAETWHRILNAIERLQAKAPAGGRRCIRGVTVSHLSFTHLRRSSSPPASCSLWPTRGRNLRYF
jgi:hypothetical protein